MNTHSKNLMNLSKNVFNKTFFYLNIIIILACNYNEEYFANKSKKTRFALFVIIILIKNELNINSIKLKWS